MRAASAQAPVENWLAGMPARATARRGKDVREGDEGGGDEHSAGIGALGVLDFLRDCGGVVPAHVIPEADGDGSGEVGGVDWVRGGLAIRRRGRAG